jgi:hypothetical protein
MSSADLSAMLGPILKGMAAILRPFLRFGAQVGLATHEPCSVGWLMRKHKKLAGHKNTRRRNAQTAGATSPRAFVHWSMGYLS